jgi:hypothetical protein
MVALVGVGVTVAAVRAGLDVWSRFSVATVPVEASVAVMVQ